MLRFVALTAALLGLSFCERLTSPSFDLFMAQHSRTYETEEEHNSRYWTFYKNMLEWELMNKMEQGTATYGMNQFSDMTTEEFTANYLSPMTEDDLFYANMIPKAEEVLTDAPESVDWRTENVVTDVKNQGTCGSCWAFSTTGNVEGLYAIKTGDLVSLSEQELVDCDVVDHGCNGGLPYQAYAEIMRLGGLVSEDNYAYTGHKDKCHMDASQVVATVSGREKVDTDEAKIAAYVAANGPVSIGINANMMQFYTGGIAHPWSFLCSPWGLNHGVLITGYGTESGTPYWTIKNSWGTGWGEKGYYRIYRGDGSCGVNLMVTSATL